MIQFKKTVAARHLIIRLFNSFVIRIFFLCILLIPAQFSFSQSFPSIVADDPSIPWHIMADEISYEAQSEIYVGQGHVIITKGDRKLIADYVEFNKQTMDAIAKGHVVLSSGNDVLTGEKIMINLITETGIIEDGTIFLSENHFYITGNTIKKIDPKTFTADHASVTTCDGSPPAWIITGKNVKVTIEGYGTVQDATFRINRLPLLYVPYLIFPVKLKRQTGLLIPQITYSDRNGVEYLQPLFWAINESSDATLYWHYFQNRGNQIGVEYRYLWSPFSKGTWMFDFLSDRQIDDGTHESTDAWGYSDDTTHRKNSDRYWFRLKHDQKLPLGITSSIDMDWVSDQDYLIEFKRGLNGFEKSQTWFQEFFGRGLDDYNDPIRSNRFYINRLWDTVGLSSELRWYQNALERNIETDDDPDMRHKLPLINFSSTRIRLFDSFFYAGFHSEYVNFYRDHGTNGHRIDIHPKIYLPIRYKNYFTFESSVGFRETMWITDEPGTSNGNSIKNRELFEVHGEIFSEIFRWFGESKKGAGQYRHSIKPLLSFDYIPEVNQHDIPHNDFVDRIESENRLTLSITQFLTKKSFPTNTENSENSNVARFNQLCRLKIEQSYYPDESEHVLSTANGFSPLYGELDVTPLSFITFHADASWNHDRASFDSRNIGIRLSDGRNSLVAEHRYVHHESESVNLNLSFGITSDLSTYIEYERNIFEHEDIRKEIRLSYSQQCWSIAGGYSHEGNDHRVDVTVNFLGLGSITGK